MPRYYVTVAPESPDGHPGAPAPTRVIDAPNEEAARDHAEVAYRRAHPTVEQLRIRVTPKT
jgi:hypothetical protein